MLAQQFQGPSVDWWSLSPLLVLLGGGMAVLLGGALTGRLWPKGLYAAATATTAGAAMVLCFFLWDDVIDEGSQRLVGDALVLDGFGLFVTIVVCVAVILASLLTDDYLRRESLDGPEVYGLYLMAAIGGVVMAVAHDLLVLFIGLEALSIALYVLAASHRRRIESQESGLKYFVLGGFSSAFFLYGVALVYGATGTTNLGRIATFLDDSVAVGNNDALLLAGVALLLVGLGFKVAAVPFHTWAPDVYQGAPTPVTGFMASAAKAAAFAALLRVIVIGLEARQDDWRPVVWALAVLTLLVGSVMAVVQTDVKRMLAFSSVSHAGFILVGVEAAGRGADPAAADPGISGVLVYLVAYAVLVLRTFGVISLVSRTGDGATDLTAFQGLARQRPALALALTLFLLAQAGVPLTSGFIAKFGVISAAVDVHSYALALVAMLAAVIAAFLYLRVIVSMYLTDAEPGSPASEPVRVPLSTGVAIGLSAAFTLVVGFVPGWLLDLARDAAQRTLG
jgi:NADH-quinone oxidoreductase subunit N